MRKLPENFEREFWDLMFPVVTDGTTKSRRNLLVSSFVIVALYILGKSLSDLNVFGFSLEGSDKKTILYIAIALILFWVSVFSFNVAKDRDLNAERKLILDDTVARLKKYKDGLESKFSNVEESNHNKNTMRQVQGEYQRYTSQLDRTKRARALTALIYYIDLALPLAMSFIAIGYLAADLWNMQ